MKSYHEGKKLSKVLMSVVSIILCTMIVAMSTLTAFAGSAVDAKDGNILVFNSIDDIAADEICLITFGDLDQEGADSEGRAIIGGDAIIRHGWAASVKSKFQNDFALIVGGDVKAEGGYGYLAIGGCFAIPAGHNMGASYGWDTQGCCQHGGYQYAHRDTTGWIKTYVDNAEIAFKSASAQYSSRPNNGSIKINGSTATLSPASGHKSGDPHVFNIDGNAISAVNFSGSFGSDSILINISGTKPHCYGAEDGNTMLQKQAVWNYYEATDISIAGNSVQGSLLAPYATFTGSNGHVNGTTIVNKMVGAGGFEYHTGNFFKDPLKAALTVTKVLSDGSTPNDDFGFTLYEQNGSSWKQVQKFTLKAGESKGFADLPEGHTYKVVEDQTGAYELLTVTGGSVNNVSERSAIFTVSALSYKVIFTNEASTGSLTVKKSLDDSVNPNAKFNFKVQYNNNGVWEDIAGAVFTLGNGESKTIEGLSFGTYRVVEDTDTLIYQTVVNGTETNSAEVTVSAANQSPEVTFQNNRKTAVLTVNKALKQGDKDTGETFSFQLYKEVNGSWQAEGEAFTLAAGAQKQFQLPVGVNYKVEETSSGSAYQLDSSTNNEIYLTYDATASFVNAITRTGITVYKQVEGVGGNADDEFSFTIVGPDLNTEFKLKAGQSQTFTGLQPGDQYVITETGMNSIYEFVKVEGGSANGQATTVAVAEGASATFTNKVKTGEIAVTKTLNDTVAPDAVFNFTVKDAQGQTVGTLALANGETKSISGLPYGGVYTVTEAVDANSYVTTYSVDGSTAIEGATTDYITISGNHAVTFTNSRASATIKVTKALVAGAADLKESYTFQLYKKTNNGWVPQGGAFTLNAGDTQTLTADVGAEYAVVETSTGKSYVLDTVAGGTKTVSIDGSVGTSFTVKGATNITFTNKLKTGSIYVYKKLNDNIYPDSSFTFTLQRKSGSEWVNVEMISIKQNQGYQFQNLVYGEQYRVVESVNNNEYTTSYVVNEATVANGKLTTGNAVVSGVSNETNGFVLDAPAKAVTFTNTRNTASLTIKKAFASGSKNLGESFTFSLERLVNGEWVNTGKNILIDFKNGDSVTVNGLEVGVRYRITETSTGKSYNYSGVSGVDNEEGNGGIITLNNDATVIITNAIKTGKIVVTKTVEDDTDPDAKFTFNLYQKVNSAWEQYGQSFQLGNGQSKEFNGLPYGGTFKVVETANGRYTTSYKIAGSTVNENSTGELVIDSDTLNIGFTNTRKTANLKVSKGLVDGSADFGESFSFVLQRQKDDNSWVDVESFQLKNAETESFKLAAGASYRVLETNSGASYRFDSVEGGTHVATTYKGAAASGAFFTLDSDVNIKINNAPKGAEIIVRKSVIGTNYGDTFTFDVLKLQGSDYVKVETISLKAGEYKTVDVLLGEQYKIVETNLDSKYTLTGISGADTDDVNAKYALVTVDGSEDITFVNTVKTGSIAVTKTLKDSLDTNATFVFEAYKQAGDEWVLIDSETLGANDTWEIKNIDYGTVVRIVETGVSESRYTTTNTVGGTTEALITVDGEETVGFTNTRKNASLKVTKALSEGTNNIGGMFNFELMVEKNGAWASVTGFNLSAGESKKIDNLYADATYLLIEKLGTGKYLLDTFAGGTRVKYNDFDAVKFVTSADAVAEITAYNKNAQTTLTIDKTVTGEYDNEAFSFVVEKKVGEEYVPVNSFDLVSGASKSIVVKYGDEYRITETINNVNYKLTGIEGADSKNGSEAIIVIDNADEKVSYTNERKTASISVEKLLADGANDVGGVFKFSLYEKDGSKWTFVEDFELNFNGKKSFADLVAGKEYLVVEKLEEGSKYELESVNGGVATVFEGNKGVIVAADSESVVNAVFTNKNASPDSPLEIWKHVEGEYRGEEFKFTCSINGGAEKEFTLKDGECYKVNDLKYGDRVVINETDDGEYFELKGIEGTTNTDGTKAIVEVTVGGQKIIYTNANTAAKLTINKKLAEGSKNIGGEFVFDVYHVKGETKTCVASDIKLALDGSKTIENLISGETYEVVERTTGEGYVCVANNKKVTLEPGKDNVVDVYNKNAGATVTLRKFVDASYAPDATDEFEFTVKVNGQALEENVVLTAGGEYKLDVKYGDVVEFEEVKLNGKYVLADINGADKTNDKIATVTVDSDNEVVTYTNKIKTASISVEKNVVEKVPAGERFTFKLLKMNEEGEYVDTKKTITLANGEKKSFDNLEYGEYAVEEVKNADYNTSFITDADDDPTDGNVADLIQVKGKDRRVSFTNTRKTVYVTITKDLLNGEETNEKFSFLLQQLDENGAWKDIKTVTITGEGTSEAIELDVKSTYRVIETSTGASYVYNNAYADDILSGTTVATDKGCGVEFVPAGSGNITFENKLKTTTLTVSKTVENGNATEFEFYYIVNDGEVQTANIKAGEKFTIKNIKYTDVVKVFEKADENYRLANINVAGEDIDKSAWLTDEENNANGVAFRITEDASGIIFTNEIKKGSVTVTKTVNDDYLENAAGVFNFRLEMLKGSEWVDASNGIFPIKAGESKTFKNIDYGTLVRVVEIVDNAELYSVSYKVDNGNAVNINATDLNAVTNGIVVSGDNNVEIINTRNTAKLSIKKSISGADLGDVFDVIVEKIENGSWTEYQRVSLAAGETKTINVGVGVEYRVRELVNANGNYEFVSISEGANISTTNEYLVALEKANSSKTVVVANTIKNGSIKVTKTLDDTIDAAAKFGFSLIDEQGNIVETVELGNNGTYEFKNLPYGSIYKVVETVNGDTYTTEYAIDGGEAVIGANVNNSVTTDSITVMGQQNVEVINTRNTASITVTKSLRDGDEDLGETFYFVLQLKNGENWITVKEFNLTAAEGENVAVLEGLYVNATYRVMETKSGEHYILNSVTGGDRTADEIGDGVKFVLDKSGNNVGFINTIVRGGLVVTKYVEGEGNQADKFSFNIKGHGIDEDFTLAAGESKEFTDLVVGYEYTVSEDKTMDGKYEYKTVVGEGSVNNGNQCITVEIPEEGAATVDFYNTVKTGKLTVSKTLVDPAADLSTKFSFVVTDENGNTVGEAILGNGESKEFDGLYFGKTYTVTETNVDNNVYSTTYSVNAGAAATGSSAAVTVAQAENTVEFVNTRNASTLTIEKNIGSSDYMAPNEEFYITVSGIFEDGQKTLHYVISADGQPVEGTKYGDLDATYIALGQKVTVPGTLYGQEYNVTEHGSTYYTVIIDGEQTDSANIKVLEEKDISITNLRNTASVTLKKELVDTENNYEDTFRFQLQVLDNGEWVNCGDVIEIAVGENMETVIEGLTCGRSYRITEIDSGVNYMFASVEGTGSNTKIESNEIEFVLDENKTVTFKNRPDTCGLTVFKKVSEVGKEDELFAFGLYKGNDTVPYKTFTLKAGDSFFVDDLPIGESYKVIELSSGDAYVLSAVEIVNGTGSELKENGALTGVQELKLDSEKCTEVYFTNSPIKNKLTVEKKLSGADNGEAFTFDLMKGEEIVDTFTLKNGQTKKFDVYYGVDYKVVERQTSNFYELASVTGADNFNLGEGVSTVKVNGDETITYTNKCMTGEIVLSKTIIGFAPKGDTFEFTVKYEDGTAVKSNALNNGKVVLKDGESVVISGIEYGKSVIISEKLNGTSYTTTYTVGNANGEGTQTGAIAINSPSTKVDFFNKYEEPVVLNAYKNGDYASNTVAQSNNTSYVEDQQSVVPSTTTNPPATTSSTKENETTASYNANATTASTAQQTVITNTNNNQTVAPTVAPPTVATAPTTAKNNSIVLGASEINSINHYNTVSKLNTPDGDQIITRVLGDSDTPDTGDEIPVSVVIALAVSSVMVLTLGKKRKSAAF